MLLDGRLTMDGYPLSCLSRYGRVVFGSLSISSLVARRETLEREQKIASGWNAARLEADMKGTFDASQTNEVRGGDRKLVYGFFSREARDS